MLIWTIKTAIISFLFIFLVHHLILFLKSTLTVPKIKDLVNSPHHKYQHIFDTLSKPQHNQSYTALELLPQSSDSLSSSIDLLPTISDNTTSMKDELKNFLKGQLTNNSS